MMTQVGENVKHYVIFCSFRIKTAYKIGVAICRCDK